MTNETLADICRQTRDRLAAKANDRIGQLADLLAGTPEASHIVGSLRSLVEMLRDSNSDDAQLDLRGMANLFDLRAMELAAETEYRLATQVIECAEAFARRQRQIDESEFREPSVDRGSIR